MKPNIPINKFVIPTYIINLPKRTDRKENIIKEFTGKDEFEVRFVEPKFNDNPSKSLWNTIVQILMDGLFNEEELILICEDDHQFSEHYSKDLLFKCISEARKRNCELLSGGVSCARSTFQLTDRLFWMEDFTGLQFTIVFNKIFQQIIDYEFSLGSDADIAISSIINNKFLIYPFISTQKDFGYSDVTVMNNFKGRLDSLFSASSARVENLKKVTSYYNKWQIKEDKNMNFENICLPTYVVLQNFENNCLENLKQEFKNREEFAISMIKPIATGTVTYIDALLDVITSAIQNKDDVIVICEEDHKFTKHYSRDFLIRNILAAHSQGANLLLGDIADFDSAVSITNDRFWINSFTRSKFMVIFKKMFGRIISELGGKRIMKDHVLSEITSHKMVMFPFISTHDDLDPLTSQKLIRIRKAHQFHTNI